MHFKEKTIIDRMALLSHAKEIGHAPIKQSRKRRRDRKKASLIKAENKEKQTLNRPYVVTKAKTEKKYKDRQWLHQKVA